jgi:hypothetical protein
MILKFAKEETEGSTVQIANSGVGEEVITLSRSLHSCVEGASKEGDIPVSHLGYRRLEGMNRGSLTHELTRSKVVKG